MNNEAKEIEDTTSNVIAKIEKILIKRKTIKPINKRRPNKRFAILKNCLNILKSNELTLEVFLKKNPFQKRAYELPSKHY